MNLAARSATSVLGAGVVSITFSATTGSLVGADTDATWTVSGINAGSITSSQGVVGFSGFRNLTGGNGKDAFVLGVTGLVEARWLVAMNTGLGRLVCSHERHGVAGNQHHHERQSLQ